MLVIYLFFFLAEDGQIVFASIKKVIPIPGQLPGLRVTILGNYVVLYLDTLNVLIKWDGKQLIHVEV